MWTLYDITSDLQSGIHSPQVLCGHWTIALLVATDLQSKYLVHQCCRSLQSLLLTALGLSFSLDHTCVTIPCVFSSNVFVYISQSFSIQHGPLDLTCGLFRSGVCLQMSLSASASLSAYSMDLTCGLFSSCVCLQMSLSASASISAYSRDLTCGLFSSGVCLQMSVSASASISAYSMDLMWFIQLWCVSSNVFVYISQSFSIQHGPHMWFILQLCVLKCL